MSHILEKPWALLLYVFIITVLYGPVVFTGKTLQPPMYQPNGVVEGWPDGYKGRVPVNLFNVDLATPAYFEWPVNKLVGDIYKKGEVPLWNPYQAAGTPLAAQYTTRAFFPYQIAEDISPVEYWDFFILGRLLIAGFFTFLFLRQAGIIFTGAFLAGAFYMSSGSFTWFVNFEQYANNAMMLPVFLYAMERLFRYGRGRETAISALAFGLVILAGRPEAALITLILGTAYFILRVLTNLKASPVIRNVRNFFVATVLGLLLSSILIIPFAEFVKHSHHGTPTKADTEVEATQNIAVTASFLTPTAHEFPQDPTFLPSTTLAMEKTPEGEKFFFRFLPDTGVWDQLGGYSGVVCLYVMFAGLFTGLTRLNSGLKSLMPNMLFFTAFGAFFALWNLGVIPLERIGGMPFFEHILGHDWWLGWSRRWAGPAWTFSFAAAAGTGYHMIKAAFTRTIDGTTASRPPMEEQLPEGGEAPQAVAQTSYEEKAGAAPDVLKSPYLPFIAATVVLLAVFVYFLPVPFISSLTGPDSSGPLLMNLGPSLLLGSALTVLFLLGACAISILSARWGMALYALVPLGVLELWWAVPRGYDFKWLFLKSAPLVVGFYAVTLFLRSKRTMAAAASLLFFLLFILLDMNSPRGIPERYDLFTAPPYVGLLKQKVAAGRIATGYGVLYPNFAGAVGLHDIRYINRLDVDSLRHFKNTRLNTVSPAEAGPAALWFVGRPESLAAAGENATSVVMGSKGIENEIAGRLDGYSLLGVRHIILPRDKEMNWTAETKDPPEAAPPGPFQLVYDREVRIYENTQALPRAYIAFGIMSAEGFEEAQEATLMPGFQPGRTVVVEKDLPGWFNPADAAGGEGTASIVELKTNMVAVNTDSSAPGVLVLNDVYYPGWKAYVDGKKAHVYRANGVVRGVFLDKGRHRVEFRYFPLSFIGGCVLAAISVISCGYLTVIDVFKRSKRWQG